MHAELKRDRDYLETPYRTEVPALVVDDGLVECAE